MNVYDFDKTIHKGDSTFAFWRFCVKRHPSVLLALPQTGIAALRWKLGKTTLEGFKSHFYRFLHYLKNPEDDVQKFWDVHMTYIYPWYIAQKTPDDIIISASPEFLISVPAERLGFKFMGSPVDIHTGDLLGHNCRDEEKVRRFREKYGDADIDEFYSDSFSDTPLARLAKQAFMVKNDVPTPWDWSKCINK